jgi:hypothetical protein
MIEMPVYNPLDAHRLSLSILNLGGLVNEAIVAAKATDSKLGELGMIALNKLIVANDEFGIKLVTKKTHPLTEQIAELDKERDECFLEIRRTAKTAAKSSILPNAEAGKLLEAFVNPY